MGICRDSTPVMENHIEKRMKHGKEVVYLGLCEGRVPYVITFKEFRPWLMSPSAFLASFSV